MDEKYRIIDYKGKLYLNIKDEDEQVEIIFLCLLGETIENFTSIELAPKHNSIIKNSYKSFDDIKKDYPQYFI